MNNLIPVNKRYYSLQNVSYVWMYFRRPHKTKFPPKVMWHHKLKRKPVGYCPLKIWFVPIARPNSYRQKAMFAVFYNTPISSSRLDGMKITILALDQWNVFLWL